MRAVSVACTLHAFRPVLSVQASSINITWFTEYAIFYLKNNLPHSRAHVYWNLVRVCVQNICTSDSDEKFLCLWMNPSTSNRWFRVSEKKVLRRTFRSKEYGGKKEDWERCTARRSVNLNLQNNINIFTPRSMRWVWNVARMGKLKII